MCSRASTKTEPAGEQGGRAGYFAWDPRSNALPHGAAAFYDAYGYLVLTGHQPVSSVVSIKGVAEGIMRDFLSDLCRLSDASTFTTSDEQAQKLRNDDFLQSASGVSCFVEEEESKSESENGNSKKAVNKIGHALHDLQPTFEEFSRGPNVSVVAHALLYNPVPVQSMYIVKGAKVGGEVRPHRDATFLMPVSGRAADCIGLWWAVEDATMHNGCLWVVPGSHRDPVTRRFVRSGNQLDFVGDELNEAADADYLPVEVRAGDLVVLHGNVLHKSEHNASDRSRHAYSVHVVRDGLKADCWLRRSEGVEFRPLT